MQKNLYYKSVLQRENIFKERILMFFLVWMSYPRLLLETFIRKNFGERYFRLSSAITLVVVLAGLPFLLKWLFGIGVEIVIAGADEFDNVPRRLAHVSARLSMTHYLTWFIFIAAFLGFSIKRYIEVKRNPSVFDFAKYSLYAGDINPVFYKILLRGKKPTVRIVETLLEPAPFFIAGLLLWLLGQYVGILLAVSAIFYSLGYAGSYDAGDNFVMDKIDQIICNEELKKTFVDGMDGDDSRGFRFVGRKPADAEKRKQILLLMTDEEEIFSVQ